jgi:hypothetical protein
MEKRYLENLIIDDALASKKIAFVSGPRQVGKTTLSKAILKRVNGNTQQYYNYDDDEFRKIWIKSPKILINENSKPCFGFDEIHKDRKWKNKIKGLFDIYGEENTFLITGSARLDYYRKSGDSLQGRYFPYRLHPFTAAESAKIKPPPLESWDENASKLIVDLKSLEKLSGFPEPLWGQNELKANRWRKLYRERLIREDARDLQNVREISALENLSLLLHQRAGSQLSYESLREDIGGSHDTLTRWLGILEALYYCYRIRPYSKNLKYSLKKEPKLFLFDWGLCENEGARWENMISGHLLKNVHLWNDAAMGDFELFYLRDKQKREVDFLVTRDRKPWLMVEVKSNSSNISSSLEFYNNLLKPKFCFQVVKNLKSVRPKSISTPNIEIIHAEKFLSALN